MDNFKYISENTAGELSFHDCCASQISFDNGRLVLEMEWLEVLASHPLNPYPKAHQSGEARVVFEGARIISCSASKGELSVSGEKLTLGGAEILKYDEEKTKEGFAAKLDMIADDKALEFILIEFTFEKSYVMWNELGDTSWFEDVKWQKYSTIRKNKCK